MGQCGLQYTHSINKYKDAEGKQEGTEPVAAQQAPAVLLPRPRRIQGMVTRIESYKPQFHLNKAYALNKQSFFEKRIEER